jgi:hypothetical protein
MMVVVVHELADEIIQMSLAEHNELIQALRACKFLCVRLVWNVIC